MVSLSFKIRIFIIFRCRSISITDISLQSLKVLHPRSLFSVHLQHGTAAAGLSDFDSVKTSRPTLTWVRWRWGQGWYWGCSCCRTRAGSSRCRGTAAFRFNYVQSIFSILQTLPRQCGLQSVVRKLQTNMQIGETCVHL